MADKPTYPSTYRKAIQQSQLLPKAAPTSQYSDWYKKLESDILGKAATANPPQLEFPSDLEEPFKLPEATAGEEAKGGGWFQPAKWVGKGIEYALKPFVWTNEHLDKPWAALLLLAQQGITPGQQGLEKALAEKKPGDNFFSVITKAYKESDLAGWKKFFLETTMPLWWVFPSEGIARAMGVTAKVLKGSDVGGAMLSKFVNNPVVKGLTAESLYSKTINAPTRIIDGMEWMRGGYEKLNKPAEQLLNDIRKGVINGRVVSEMTKSGLKPALHRYEAMNVLLTDSFARNEVGRQLPSLIKEYQKGYMTFEDISTWLGGITKQAVARKAGAKVPGVARSAWRDAYAFWRAGVLTTPWYVMQNYWENFFRTMTSTFEPFRFAGFETAMPIGKVHIPYLKNMWSALKGYPMPSELADANLNLAARLEGYSSVTVLRKVARENLALKKTALRKATTEAEKIALNAQITKWEGILEEAPKINVSAGGAITPTEAVSGIEAVPGREHPITRWITHLESKGLDLSTPSGEMISRAVYGDEGAKRFREGMKGWKHKTTTLTRKIINAPRAAAAMSDYGGKSRVWVHAYTKRLTALMQTEQLPNRAAFMAEALPLGVQKELKAVGYTDDEIAILYKRLHNVKNEKDLKFLFSDYLENPIPTVGKLPDNSVIPQDIWNQYGGVLQKKILDGDKQGALDILQNIVDDGYLHQLDMEKTAEPWMEHLIRTESKHLSRADNDFLNQAVGMMKQMKADKVKHARVEAKIFGKSFLEKFKAQRGMYEAAIEQRRQEALTLSHLIIQQLTFPAKGAARISRSSAAMKVTRRWSELNSETGALKDEVLSLTWKMEDKLKEINQGHSISDLPIILTGKEVPGGNEMLDTWKKLYNRLLKRDPRAVRGLSKNEVNVSQLWANERLYVSEVWKDTINTLASENDLLWALPKFSQSEWWSKFTTDVNKTLKKEVLKQLRKGNAIKIGEKGEKLLGVQDNAIKSFHKLEKDLLAEWRTQMNAADFATHFSNGVMGNYAVTTNLDSLMNNIVPFWYFPSRSIPYYLKTFAQKPYSLAFMTRYMNQAKEGFGSPGEGGLGQGATPEALVGYFPISIGDQTYFLNPFRPWMGYQMLGYEPMAGLGQPIVQQTFQAANMLGIGIAPQWTMSLEGVNKWSSTGGIYLTRGEPMPLFPQERWLQDMSGAAFGNYAAMPEQAMFSQNVNGMPDWEKRNVEKELARWIIRNPDKAAEKGWKFPRDILAVQDSDIEATDTVKQQIKRMSRYGLLSVVLPIYSRRNSEELKTRSDREQTIKDILKENGVNPDKAIERAQKVGFSPMMYLDRQQRREIYEAHPEWEPWSGLTRVGINPQERAMETQTQHFYRYMDSIREQLGNRLSTADDAFLEGHMSGYQWRQVYEEIQVQNSAIWRFLIGDGLAPDKTSNPGILPLARVTPSRSEWYRNNYAKAIPPIHPEDYALDYYYSIQPEIDPLLGTYDYDSYFARREEFYNSLASHPEIQKYIDDDRKRARYGSPVEEIFRADRELLQPYFAVRRQYEKEHPEYEILLKQARTTQDPLELARIRKQLNVHEREISRMREQVRKSDARIEAALFKWGYVSTFVNPLTPELLKA